MGMRLQSAIEFLTTYAFLFIVLATSILLIAFLVSSSRVTINSQCTSYSNIQCNFAGYYSNPGRNYSLVVFSIINSQSSAINITSATVTLASITSLGTCSPNFLYPGEGATCSVNISSTTRMGVAQNGYYQINARYCNAAPQGLTYGCSYENVSYRGGFYAYSLTGTPTPIFSVVAAVGNLSTQLAPYSNTPQVPLGYKIVQEGDWVAKGNSSFIAYSFGTGTYVGGYYFGISTSRFPAALSSLNNANVRCAYPYNSTLSAAFSTLYLPSPTTLNLSVYATSAMEVYYKGLSGGWKSIFGGTLWPASPGLHQAQIAVGRGIYGIAVVWSDDCGQGLQAFELGGPFAPVTTSTSTAATTASTTSSSSTSTTSTTTIPAPNYNYTYVANYNSGTVSVINTNSNLVAGTITVQGGPYGVAITPNRQYAYVTNYGGDTVSVINTQTGAVVTNIPVAIAPIGIAITPNGNYAYVANHGSNNIYVINTTTNAVTSTISVNGGPYGLAVTPNGQYLYVADAPTNNVSVISTATNKVVSTIGVGGSPYGVAITPNGNYVYVTNDGSGTVSVISTATNKVVSTIPVGAAPVGIAITPNGNYVYVADDGESNVSVINTATNLAVGKVAVGTNPAAVSITPNGNYAYVANLGSNSVSVINLLTNAVLKTISVGLSPIGIATIQ